MKSSKLLKLDAFDRVRDLEIFVNWYRARGEEAPPLDMLPEEWGYVVRQGETALAMGFLMGTTTKLCFGEFYQTNPAAPKNLQSRAYIYLHENIMRLAKNLGFRAICGIVSEDKKSIIRYYTRSIGGYSPQKSFRVIVKNLGDL